MRSCVIKVPDRSIDQTEMTIMLTQINSRSLGRALRLVAILEGISYLLFAITMPLKYGYDITAPNYYVGMAHGMLFLLYLLVVAVAARRFRWSLMDTGLSFLASLIPFGTFYMDYKLFRRYGDSSYEEEIR